MTETIIVRKVKPTDLKQGDVIINIGTVTEIEVYKNLVVAHITHLFFNNRIDRIELSPNFPVTVRP
jgi:hypothetical protein